MLSSTTEDRDIHEHWRGGGPSFDRQELDHDDEDIYRGGRPVARHSNSSSASSSSSSSIQLGGRLGAIAAVVELAISRWARNRSSSSASSISTATNSRSHTYRRRHPSSSSNLRSVQSERDIAARIKAREESRQSPREFALYLIPTAGPGNQGRERNTQPLNHEQGIAFTTSLPLILERLDHAMKKSIKAQHNQIRSRSHKARIPLPVSLPFRHDNVLHEDRLTASSSSANGTTFTGSHKGKRKEVIVDKIQSRDASDEHVWLLDVSSPTWEDMRAIGKASRSNPSHHSSGILMPISSCCISTL
jgi:magnesium transporter